VRAFAYVGFAALFVRALFGQNADMHASPPNSILEMRTRFVRGRYELKNATLVDLIRTAWSVDADKVVGGPDWLDTDRFDVIVTAPVGSTPEMLKTMLLQVLVDRFHLVAHNDTRAFPAYAITAGRKPQIKPADESEAAECRIEPGEPVAYTCRNMTIAALASRLPNVREASGYLFNYPVVDRTGLKGAWDFTVKWSPRIAVRAHPAPAETITIFDAFDKQLGLKLEFTKIPTPVVVVESAKPPQVTESPAALPEFEVAEIKPQAPGIECPASVAIQPGGRVNVNMTLKWLIVEAWGASIPPNRITGGPKSIDDACFVVVAKAPVEENAVAGWNGPVWNGVDIDSMRMMLRALLADRFKLAAHTEERPVPGYELVAANPKLPKLRKADPSYRPGCREGPGADGKDPRIANPAASRLITCRNMTLAQFAAELNKLFVEFPRVMDSTGIAGRYDITFNFSPGGLVESSAADSEPNGAISLSEALKGQLGLRLQSRKVMAPVLVIDHVNEMPTEN
jgi:uncharacterized protein (TIGR03435 family)